MRIDYFGPGDFLTSGFLNTLTEGVDLEPVVAQADRLVLRNPSNGWQTTLTGTGLGIVGDTVTGTVTAASFADQTGRVVATVSGVSWPLGSFVGAMIALLEQDNPRPLQALLDLQPIILDASTASAGLTSLNFEGTTSTVTVTGSRFGDEMEGGNGNDVINLGRAPSGGGDRIYGSPGMDTIRYTDVRPGEGFNDLSFSRLDTAITATINGAANTGSITSTLGTTTLIDVVRVLDWNTEGFFLIGSSDDDSFTIDGGPRSWIGIQGDRGNDSYALTLSGDIRLAFFGGYSGGATQGIVADLRSGTISNDGFGFADTITLAAGPGRLEIEGTDFADSIIGTAGNDSFILRGGSDTLDGGAGIDRLRYDRPGSSAAVTVDLTQGTATGTWRGQAFTHRISNIEVVRGTNFFDDTLIGDAAANLLEGRGGADRLVDGGGIDTLLGGIGADVFALVADGQIDIIADFEPGTDRIDLTAWAGLSAVSQLTLTQTPAGLRIAYGSEILVVNTFNGAPIDPATVTAASFILAPPPPPPEDPDPGPGDITGTAAADRLAGTDGSDRIFGLEGNDTLTGGAGDDTLYGGPGRDRLDGEGGANTLRGGLGDDRYVIRSAGDVIEGEVGFSQGGGIDTVEAWISYTLPRNVEILRLQGTDNLNGTGGAAPEALVGNTGANDLRGNGGNDVLNGKAGDDTLIGGTGADSLVGEGGADVFVFTAVADSRPGQANRDFINGFERGIDRIDLSLIDANSGTADNDAFTFIGNAAFSGVAGQLRFFTFGGGNFNIVEADVNGDRVADMQIFVNLTNVMQAGDFVL